eukprot:m.213757 g.213757  ORF g.213757 m.213757 type:complete len:571 (+) comp17179_c0_seq2:176-1888(+)
MSRRNPFHSSSESEELTGNPFETPSVSKHRNPFDDDDDDDANTAFGSGVDDPFGLSPKPKAEATTTKHTRVDTMPTQSAAIPSATTSASNTSSSTGFAAVSIRDKIAQNTPSPTASPLTNAKPIKPVERSMQPASHPTLNAELVLDDTPSHNSPFRQVSDAGLTAEPVVQRRGRSPDERGDSISEALETVALEEPTAPRVANLFDSNPSSPSPFQHTQQRMTAPMTHTVATAQRRDARHASDEVVHLGQGEELDLLSFRNVKVKLALLDQACQQKHGRVILQLLLYLERSISQQQLIRILSSRPLAWKRFRLHLRQTGQWGKLLELSTAIQSTDVSTGPSQVEASIRQQAPRHWQWQEVALREFYTSQLEAFIELLRHQIQVDHEDTNQSSHNPIFQAFPKKQPLYGSSLDTSLYYHTLYHHKASSDPSLSTLIQTHGADHQQSHHVVSRALIQKHAFDLLREYHSKKSLFGSSKLAFKVKPELLCEFLQQARAPPAACGLYVEAITNAETRFTCAANLQCHSLAIQALIELKDGAKLRKYGLLPSVQKDAGLQARIYSALRNTSINWTS